MNIQRYEESLQDSNIQTEKHLPTGAENSNQNERNILYSIHQRGKRKTLWYQSIWETMEANSVPTNKERVTYKSKIYPYHALHRCLMTTVLPEIKVKPGENVTISWCKNTFINIVKEYRLLFNDTELQYGNTKVLFSRIHSLELNYTGCHWGSSLSSQPISIRLPVCYDGNQTNAFPLSLCGQNDRLHHIFEFNLMLENLLLMKNDKGQIIDLDMSKLEVSNNVDCVPIPELEGLYTIHTSKECDLSNCKENEVGGDREYFVDNCYYIEDDNDISLGKRIQIKFDSKTNYPVEEMVWGAVNVTMTNETKNLTVTTSNENTPIKNTKLETSLSTVIDSKDSFKTEYAYRNDVSDYIKGLSYWKNEVVESDGKSFRPGINFSGGKITINTNSDNLNCKFMAFVIMNHTRRFLFRTYPKTQEERLVKGATIELVNE
jgi:hypothetical protein